MGYTDVNRILSMQTNQNSYAQMEIQNTNTGASASSDVVVGNNNTTSTTYYGDFGMNSSGWVGTGAFVAPNNVYLTATSADLAIGTTTANAIKFAVNGGTTDAMTINSSGAIAVNGSFGTAGQVLTTQGSGSVPTWTTATAATASYTRTSFTATVGQTTFSATYTAPYIQVYQNGTLLNATDYTATNGTTVILAIGAFTGDIIETVAFNLVPIGSAAGSNTQVQYNSSGVLAGNSGFTFDGTDLNIPFGTSNSATSSVKIALALSMIA
jgi:hypothetical protein